MNLHEAIARCRTLVVEGPDDIGRTGLLLALAAEGFQVGPASGVLPHVDPTRPVREVLAGPGRIALDGSPIRELVYGPLRHGRSRVTWIQALDFAETVAERDGALLYVVAPSPTWPGCAGPAAPATGPAVDEGEAAAVRAAYERAFTTLAQHVPVVRVAPDDAAEPGPQIRLPSRRRGQHGRNAQQLTVGLSQTT